MTVKDSAEEADIGNIMESPLHRQTNKLRFDLTDMGCQKRLLYRDNNQMRS